MRLASIVALTAGGPGSGRYHKGSGQDVPKEWEGYNVDWSGKGDLSDKGLESAEPAFIERGEIRPVEEPSILNAKALANKISKSKRFQAIVVERNTSGSGEAWSIYEGHHRHLATRFLGKATVPVLIKHEKGLKAGGVGSGRYPKGSGVDRSAIAKRNKIQIVGQKEQKIANLSEQELSDGLGIPRSGNNKPFDLQDQSKGVEVKTLLFQKNDKITMIKSALARKNAEAQRLGLRTYTVVADKRSSPTTYYYAKGLGSFVIRGMHKVNSMSELKGAIK